MSKSKIVPVAVSALVSALKSNDKASLCIAQAAREAVEAFSVNVKAHGKPGDAFNIVAEACTKVAASIPVVMESYTGKNGREYERDANTERRNNVARVLNVALNRAGKAAKVGVKFGLSKDDEGRYTVTVKDAEAATDDGDGEGDAGAPDPDSPEATALWTAVELVLANLSNPAVLSAIKSGLQNLANAPSK